MELQLWMTSQAQEYKFNHMFCWKIEIPCFPFIIFSITTPAIPARPEEQIVNTAGNTGMERVLRPDFAIWIDATLDVRRRREAHWTPDNLAERVNKNLLLFQNEDICDTDHDCFERAKNLLSNGRVGNTDNNKVKIVGYHIH